MSDDRYSRQSVLNIKRSQTVSIVGCGGVGSWVALMLGMAGVRCLHLFDTDTVTIDNLNRLPVPVKSVGKPKVQALADLINSMNPDVEVVCHTNLTEGINSDYVARSSWVVCATDSLESRRLTHRIALKGGSSFIECGAEGLEGSVDFSPGELSTELENSPGYQIVPVFVGPCAFAASIVCYYVLLGCYGYNGYRTFRVEWDRGARTVRLVTILDEDDDKADENATDASDDADDDVDAGV